MTHRFQLALAGLIALGLGTALTWFLIGSDKPQDTQVEQGPDSIASDGGRDDGALLRGTETDPEGTQPGNGGAAQPGGTNSNNLVGSREPFGPDYSDPAFRAKKLAELLGAPAIQWKEVKRLLSIMDEPLSAEAKRILAASLRTGPRGYVLEAIAVSNDGTLSVELLELVDDAGATEAVRQAALLALGRMRGADADEVSKQLESRLIGDFRRDANILIAIAERGGSEAARAVVEYLTSHADAQVFAQTFNRFDLADDEAAAQVFQAALLKDPSPVVAKQLLLLVGKPGSGALVSAIVKLEAGDAPLEVRKAALKSLGRIGSTEAVQHLLSRARESGAMGEAALRSLDSLRSADEGAREALRKELARAGLAARPTESKARLLRALGRLHDKQALPDMLTALDDPDPKVERAAILAIGGLGRHAKSAVPRLVQVYTAGNTETRHAVVHAMGSMGGQDELTKLQEWSKEEDLEPTLTRMLRQAILTIRSRVDGGKQ